MSEPYCQHGYSQARRCPQCSLPDDRGRRRSVYEHRELATVDEEQERWRTLGTIDPLTGRAQRRLEPGEPLAASE